MRVQKGISNDLCWVLINNPQVGRWTVSRLFSFAQKARVRCTMKIIRNSVTTLVSWKALIPTDQYVGKERRYAVDMAVAKSRARDPQLFGNYVEKKSPAPVSVDADNVVDYINQLHTKLEDMQKCIDELEIGNENRLEIMNDRAKEIAELNDEVIQLRKDHSQAARLAHTLATENGKLKDQLAEMIKRANDLPDKIEVNGKTLNLKDYKKVQRRDLSRYGLGKRHNA